MAALLLSSCSAKEKEPDIVPEAKPEQIEMTEEELPDCAVSLPVSICMT